MKTKLVLWGKQDAEKIMLAMELRPEANKVDVWVLPDAIVTESISQQIMGEWRNGGEITFPEGTRHVERDLSVSDAILSDDISVDRIDLVQRAQTEWHFIVLSTKMHQVYRAELDELKEKVSRLEAYDNGLWDGLKEFWDKVHGQVRDRNLFREHADSLKESINEQFAKLKELRSSLDNEFSKLAKDNYDKLNSALNNIEKRITDGGRVASIFDELKEMQRQFRDTKLSREYRNEIWARIDSLFKTVKEKRFGKQSAAAGNDANNNNSASDRLTHRVEGLVKAIEKMESSIDRDRRDLEFELKKIRETDGQLEAQIRQAKIKMIESRIQSKEEKLQEMRATLDDLDKKTKAQHERDQKRAERMRVEEAKKEVEAKITADIKGAAEARESDAEKLEKAATSIKQASTKNEELSFSEKAEDAIEDAVDTAKAIGVVVSEKVDQLFEEFNTVDDINIDEEIGIDAPKEDDDDKEQNA